MNYQNRKKYDNKYRQNHKLHRRYLSYRSTSKTFIRKYAHPDDVLALRHLWNKRVKLSVKHYHYLTPFEDVLIKKLKITSNNFTKYMEEMADWNFTKSQMKDCLDTMGRMEAFAEALMIYDHRQTKFCKSLINKGNQMIQKAYRSKPRK